MLTIGVNILNPIPDPKNDSIHLGGSQTDTNLPSCLFMYPKWSYGRSPSDTGTSQSKIQVWWIQGELQLIKNKNKNKHIYR